jgi:hypothetical protein
MERIIKEQKTYIMGKIAERVLKKNFGRNSYFLHLNHDELKEVIDNL